MAHLPSTRWQWVTRYIQWCSSHVDDDLRAHVYDLQPTILPHHPQLPADATFSYFDAEGTMQTISVGELTAGKKVILFAVPGAFTPTCSLKHLPGFIEKADELKSKGVDTIGCVATNDAFVMSACTLVVVDCAACFKFMVVLCRGIIRVYYLVCVVYISTMYTVHAPVQQGASLWVQMTRCSCWQMAVACLPRYTLSCPCFTSTAIQALVAICYYIHHRPLAWSWI